MTILKSRVQRIETHLRSGGRSDKVLSLLGQEQPVSPNNKAYDSAEKEVLTKWEVAKIVFAILGSLGVLIGLALAIIQFVAKMP